MKVKKFIKDIEDFFKSNKKEQKALLEALDKLKNKKEKLIEKLNKKEFTEDSLENLTAKIGMVEELEAKISKKLDKLNLKMSKE